MRNDIYGVYNNLEYRIGKRGEDWINLCSEDSNDLKNGFTLYKGLIYIKTVKISELSGIYSIKTYANYKGYKCQALKKLNDKVLLHAIIGDYKICEALGFEMVDRGVYNKWVNLKELVFIFSFKEK